MDLKEIIKEYNETYKKLIDTIEEYRGKLKQLIEEEKKIDNGIDIWIPELNEVYYTFHSIGEIDRYIWKDDEIDRFRLDIGNVFRTEEEVENYIFRRKLEQKAKVYQAEHNKEKIDWNNNEQAKWSIYYYYNKNCFDTFAIYGYKENNSLGYFTSQEDCEKFIEENKEDLLKYINIK